ncbi:DUF819 family protein [Williamwhitmania taraxaci]|uniref:Uncharacterized membrane protein n=1 Tax=Williamwhitmania taraxaci TaxID=1640674 RepID=A0A1G6HF69_9BACT|nr:DUF819 family protein [Williamwhitmania taraxaci]SDB92889.1 Uncharacterized membrane protein [Williamwhitmania taraxaci]
MNTFLLILVYFGSPILILNLCHRIPFLNKLGAVIVAYMVGLLMGVLWVSQTDAGAIANAVSSVTVPLALPLLLFSAQLSNLKGIALKGAIALTTAIVAVFIAVVGGYFLLRNGGMSDLWKLSGMLLGVYTGGTPNLASLKLMLDVDPNVYILAHSYDLIVSAVYLAFVMTVGPRFFRKFLVPFKHEGPVSLELDTNGSDPYWGIFKREHFYPLVKVFGAALSILALGVGLSLLFPERLQVVSVILAITTLGVLGSFIPRLSKTPYTFELGMYFILVFSVSVASMADFSSLQGVTPHLFIYMTLVVFGALFLHLLFAKLFKIDADTLIVVSTALICSPPFVPMVASAIKNKRVILVGIIAGLVGYAIGNYLGYFTALGLSSF